MADGTQTSADGDVAMADAPPPPGAALEDEGVLRARERAALDALVHPDLRADTGASVSGLYELAGIVTHKGAGADSGHYIGFVRRDAFDGALLLLSFLCAADGGGAGKEGESRGRCGVGRWG